jgi:hypothetical protein
MIYMYGNAFWWDEGEDLQNMNKSQDDNGAEYLSCCKHIWIKQMKLVIK